MEAERPAPVSSTSISDRPHLELYSHSLGWFEPEPVHLAPFRTLWNHPILL